MKLRKYQDGIKYFSPNGTYRSAFQEYNDADYQKSLEKKTAKDVAAYHKSMMPLMQSQSEIDSQLDSQQIEDEQNQMHSSMQNHYNQTEAVPKLKTKREYSQENHKAVLATNGLLSALANGTENERMQSAFLESLGKINSSYSNAENNYGQMQEGGSVYNYLKKDPNSAYDYIKARPKTMYDEVAAQNNARIESAYYNTTQAANPEPTSQYSYLKTKVPHNKTMQEGGYYKNGGSIVDTLKSKGFGSSFEDRKELAKEYNIPNYKGTVEQNMELLKQFNSRDALEVVGFSRDANGMFSPNLGKAFDREVIEAAPKKSSVKQYTPMKRDAATTSGFNNTGRPTDGRYEAKRNNEYTIDRPYKTPEQEPAYVSPFKQGAYNPYKQQPSFSKSNVVLPKDKYDDGYALNIIDNDPNTPRNINDLKRKDFFNELALATVTGGVMGKVAKGLYAGYRYNKSIKDGEKLGRMLDDEAKAERAADAFLKGRKK